MNGDEEVDIQAVIASRVFGDLTHLWALDTAWTPAAGTLQPLGRLRAHGSPSQSGDGTWYQVDALLVHDAAKATRMAPALLLRPRFRRAFDPDRVRAALEAWRKGKRITELPPLLHPDADADGFLLPPCPGDDEAWRETLDRASDVLLELTSEEPQECAAALRRALAHQPWSLLLPTNHLADLFPLLAGMPPVDAAMAGLLLAHQATEATDPQELRGRRETLDSPPADLDLLQALRELGLRSDRSRVLERFVVALRPHLPGPVTSHGPDALPAAVQVWRRGCNRRTAAGNGLPAQPRAVLVPDFAQVVEIPSGASANRQGVLLERWFASGTPDRMLWVMAGGAPEHNLRLAVPWETFVGRARGQASRE